MPYFPNHNILFIHIPKTGGTSFEHMLVEKNDQKLLYTPYPQNRVIPEIIYQRISLQHQFYSTIEKYKKECNVPFDDKMKVISIVRNPYDKIISDLFFYKLINEKSEKEHVFNVIKKFLHLKPAQCDNHNVPQYVFLIDNRGKLCPKIKILYTETLNSDLKKIGFYISPHKHLSSNCSKPYRSFLNDKSIDLINKIFKRDFDLFGYEKILTDDEQKKYSITLEESLEKSRLLKYGLVPGQRCKTPNCPYLANTLQRYFDNKPEQAWGYCCQDCFTLKGKSHGGICQKKIQQN